MSRPTLILLLILLLWNAGAHAAAPDSINSEFKELLLADEAALQAIDRLMAENNAFAEQGAGLPRELLSTKVHGVVDPVRARYTAFLTKHPDHVRGHLAYASFLGEFSETEEILAHLEKALALAPDDPVVLNNVAKHHAEKGAPNKAFDLIQRALEKRPDEPTYLRNLAGMMLVYRREATAFFELKDDQQLFSHASRLYAKALELQPGDFLLHTSLAQSLYHLRPFPAGQAVTAWENALKLASTPLEKEGIRIHLARVHIQDKNHGEARRHLESVTAPELEAEKKRLLAGLPVEMRPAAPSPPPAPAPATASSLFNVTTAPPPKR